MMLPPPDIRDPRLWVMVPPAVRPALAALWTLDDRLAAMVAAAREPLLTQIKLAWWRERLAALADDPGSAPAGEPLLAQLAAQSAMLGDLVAVVDGHEAMLLADGPDEQAAGAVRRGTAVFAAGGGGGGGVWGLVRVAAGGADTAPALLAVAAATPPAAGTAGPAARAHHMADRWAAAIARRGGVRRPAAEGLLLARLAIFGR